ncbi:MAG: mechanosensitive ion channel [Candidatus Competibacteraceae bacterium]
MVTISNAKIFEEPIYNYTDEFPYLWEEMTIPIPYTADRVRVERILLGVAHRHTLTLSDLSAETLRELQRRYFIEAAGVESRVYFDLTDNWLALTVRFIVRDHGIRELKDAMTREILQVLDAAGIGIASATFIFVGPAIASPIFLPLGHLG